MVNAEPDAVCTRFVSRTSPIISRDCECVFFQNDAAIFFDC